MYPACIVRITAQCAAPVQKLCKNGETDREWRCASASARPAADAGILIAVADPIDRMDQLAVGDQFRQLVPELFTWLSMVRSETTRLSG